MGANKYELDKFFHPAPIPVVRIPEAMHSSRDGKKVAATLKMQQGRQLTMMPNKNVAINRLMKSLASPLDISLKSTGIHIKGDASDIRLSIGSSFNCL